jgi:hypothetical protein
MIDYKTYVDEWQVQEDKETEIGKQIFDLIAHGKFDEACKLSDGEGNLVIAEHLSRVLINEFNDTSLNYFKWKKKTSFFKNLLLKYGYAQDIKFKKDKLHITLNDGEEVKCQTLTSIFEKLDEELPNIKSSVKRSGDCHVGSIALSINLPYVNEVVTGKLCDVAKNCRYLHSWIELELNGKLYVMDYVHNGIYPKDSYYRLYFPEVMSRVKNTDLIYDFRESDYRGSLGPGLPLKEYLLFRDDYVKDLSRI